MPFRLNDAEAAPLEFLPVGDLVDLAVELDFVPGAEIDRRELLEELVPRLLELAQREGLPFSKYDVQDLEELDAEHRRALAGAMGWPSEVPEMLKAGGKVYKTYRKDRGGSQVALLLPSLLKPLARHAAETR